MSPPSIAASLILFFVVPLTLFRKCGAAASNTTYDLRTNLCSASGGSLSDLYQGNLGRFLAELPSKAINHSGFFNGTSGSRTGTVFGMAMCHADIPWPDQCESCLQALSAKARMACPSSSFVRAATWGCVLQYSDVPIFPDIMVAFNSTQIHGASVPDIAAFTEARNQLFADLARAAVVSPLRIASKKRPFNATHSLYGLAQCNRDWEIEACFNVIMWLNQDLRDLLPADAQWSEGVSMTGFSFYIRYDLTPFEVHVPPTGSGPVQKIPAGPVEIIPAGPVEVIQGRVVMKVATIVPVSISIVVLLVVFIFMRDHQKNRKTAQDLKVANIQIFSYGNIRNATENFKTLIGEGGFGRVYKGKFNIDGNDQVLAVKCVTNPSARKQLLDELMTLARLEHRNVVKLKGFCNNEGWFSIGKHGRGLYVCNDFFIQRSLDTHIFGWANNPHGALKWPIRYEIICGICDGLKYVHEHCNNTMAHLDLKPSNILLDQEMVPKIADFGLSRTFEINKTHTYTYATMGTNGYMAPELTQANENSEVNVGCKCDIYSLGVLILAIVMGKEPTATNDPNGVLFIRKIHEKFSAENRKKFSDMNRRQLKEKAYLQDDDCLDDVENCIDLAFECVKTDPEERPLATEICRRLPARVAAGTHVGRRI